MYSNTITGLALASVSCCHNDLSQIQKSEVAEQDQGKQKGDWRLEMSKRSFLYAMLGLMAQLKNGFNYDPNTNATDYSKGIKNMKIDKSKPRHKSRKKKRG